ncbi:MAG: hypothetical protein DMF75_00340 [Acidobacteria bacterium]|nr:MAG: hypothetical protein DMF75_00340 [Acidobacteriota bacterium]
MSAQELLTEIQKLPPAEQQCLLEALKRDVKMKSERRPITEDEVEEILLANGIISEIPPRVPDDEEETFEPIEVPGKPLSESIIEERR